MVILAYFFMIILELQFIAFKCIMKTNVVSTMEPPILGNLFTWLWKTVSTSKMLQSTMLKYFKLAKFIASYVLGSVEDE
jgi:hypothetical protein